jgi:hypothetical protein
MCPLNSGHISSFSVLPLRLWGDILCTVSSYSVPTQFLLPTLWSPERLSLMWLAITSIHRNGYITVRQMWKRLIHENSFCGLSTGYVNEPQRAFVCNVRHHQQTSPHVHHLFTSCVAFIKIRVTSLQRTYDGSIAEEQLMKLGGEWREQASQCGD